MAPPAVRLYWNPEVERSLWVAALDLLWSSPLADVGLWLVGARRRGAPVVIKDARISQYLKDGKMFATSEEDGLWMVKEVLVGEEYAQYLRMPICANANGKKGRRAVVVDVGANVGAFAAWIAVQAPCTVLALEPNPPTAVALQLNAANVAPQGASIVTVQMGLAADGAKGARVPFTNFEDVPSCCTARPEDKHAANIAPLLAPAAFLTYYDEFRPWLCFWIRALPFDRMRQAAVTLAIAYLWRRSSVEVKLGSLADAFAAAGMEAPATIDVMKVDIEGMELAVLEALEDEWWPKIQQIVVEVHDFDSRCARLRSLLQSKGFITSGGRYNWCDESIGMNCHMICGVRQTTTASAGA